MKYYAPKQCPYESGLTARLMYSIVDGLIKKHVTTEDIERLRKLPSLGLTKLWDKPPIRSELEEFVRSYLFTNLEEHLPDFEEIFAVDIQTRREKLESYMAGLEAQYGSRDEAKKQIALIFGKLKERGSKLYEEIHKIERLKGVKHVIRTNAKDGFAHVSPIYNRILLTMTYIGL